MSILNLGSALPTAPSLVYTAATILDGDVRLLKVKQPWAQLLVEGRKDCENRTWRLTPSTGFPAWVLIVASKQKFHCRSKNALNSVADVGLDLRNLCSEGRAGSTTCDLSMMSMLNQFKSITWYGFAAKWLNPH